MSTSEESRVADRVNRARRASKKYSDVPRFGASSWSSGVITFFTADETFKRVFSAANRGTCTVEKLGDVVKYTGKSKMDSYPKMIHFISDGFKASDITKPLVKLVMFAREMASRATPIKGTGHEFPLTDMYMDCPPSLHYESMIQIGGQLCGIDPTCRPKTLWGDVKLHDNHVKTLDRCAFDFEMLESGVSGLEALCALERRVMDAESGGTVGDEIGAFIMFKVNSTRPGAAKRSRKALKCVSQAADENSVKIRKYEYESGLTHGVVEGDFSGLYLDTALSRDTLHSLPDDEERDGSVELQRNVREFSSVREPQKTFSLDYAVGVLDPVLLPYRVHVVGQF